MYVPKQFEETRVAVLHDFIRKHPFGVLVALTPDGLEANHLPFELDPQAEPFGTLRAHVARANPIWRSISADTEGLMLFQGPHAYVSPNWYPSKKKTGKAVPTWNYVAVHAYGRIRVTDDAAWLRGLVERLSDRHEAGREEPWKVADAPVEYTERMVRAVVGLEVEITRLIGKWKLSQNRSAEDIAGVVEGLSREQDGSAEATAELTREFLDSIQKNAD